MEWEEYFPDGVSMVAGAKQRIEGEDKPIRYVNGRYKLYGEKESRWLYNIRYQVEGSDLLIIEQEQDSEIRLPLVQVEYLKLRPFYFAACIGFKAFVFYNKNEAQVVPGGSERSSKWNAKHNMQNITEGKLSKKM